MLLEHILDLTEKFAYSETELANVTQTLADTQAQLTKALTDLDAANKHNEKLTAQLTLFTQAQYLASNDAQDAVMCKLRDEFNELTLRVRAYAKAKQT